MWIQCEVCQVFWTYLLIGYIFDLILVIPLLLFAAFILPSVILFYWGVGGKWGSDVAIPAWLAIGIIKGIAKYYNESEKVIVIPKTNPNEDRVQIRVEFK